MQTMEFLKTILRQCGLAKDIRCNEMGDTSYCHGWLKSGGKGSLMRRMMSSMMQISTYAFAGGMYVSASSRQDAPTAPPFLDRNDTLASMNIGTLLGKEKTV